MLRVLFTRRWLGVLLAATVFSVTAYFLGGWQYGKYQAKSERNRLLDLHYAAAPASVDSVLPGQAVLQPGQDWTRVQTTGTYADQPQLFVRNRVNGTAPGYEILAPLTLPDGRTLVVDRGWSGLADTGAQQLPDVPGAPGGTVTVVGWLRPGEPATDQRYPGNQLGSINLPEVSRLWNRPVLGGYLTLQTETDAAGQTTPRPMALDAPDRDLGPNQAYAFQWWSFIVAAYVLVYLGVRRDYLAEHPEAVTAAKKVRLWDEEDE